VASVLEQCLEDLAERIDPAEERKNLWEWIAFLDGEFDGEVFTPSDRTAAPPGVDWPVVPVNDAIDDYDLMLLQQFGLCSEILEKGSTERLCVRCNYGTGILPSLFGCEMFFMEKSLNTLPTCRPVGSRDRICQILDDGPPDPRGGLGGRVLRAAEQFRDIQARYPRIGEHIELYHPDVQGPIDATEVIWGSEMFYALMDEPDLVRSFLDLVTETYAAFMRAWYSVAGEPGEATAHWGLTQKGALMIRNDSLVNLSPETYVELIRPLDERLFAEFGGAGAIHFCGRGEHYIEAMSQTKGLTAINLSQPELNDMEVVYRNTVDKGIKLLGLSAEAVESANRPLRGQVHCARQIGMRGDCRMGSY